MQDTFILEDAHGNELCKIQEKKLSVRDKMTIESGWTQATVHKRLIGIRDHYVIDVDGGEDLKAPGTSSITSTRSSATEKIAEVSKKWFRVRDTTGSNSPKGQDVPLILAVTVCVDQMARG